MDELTPQPALCIVEIEHARSLLATCPCPRSHGRCRRLPRHISRCRKHLNTQPISQTRRNTPRLSHSATPPPLAAPHHREQAPIHGWLCVWLFRECLFVFFSVCRCVQYEGDEGRALVYRYVRRDDASVTSDEPVRVCSPVGRAGQCVCTYALLPPTRYIRLSKCE